MLWTRGQSAPQQQQRVPHNHHSMECGMSKHLQIKLQSDKIIPRVHVIITGCRDTHWREFSELQDILHKHASWCEESPTRGYARYLPMYDFMHETWLEIIDFVKDCNAAGYAVDFSTLTSKTLEPIVAGYTWLRNTETTFDGDCVYVDGDMIYADYNDDHPHVEPLTYTLIPEAPTEPQGELYPSELMRVMAKSPTWRMKLAAMGYRV